MSGTNGDRAVAIRESSRTAARACVVCRHVLDAVTEMTVDPDAPTRRPAAGDLTVCAYCGAILVFTRDAFRLATAADGAAVDPALWRTLLDLSALRGVPRRPV